MENYNQLDTATLQGILDGEFSTPALPRKTTKAIRRIIDLRRQNDIAAKLATMKQEPADVAAKLATMKQEPGDIKEEYNDEEGKYEIVFTPAIPITRDIWSPFVDQNGDVIGYTDLKFIKMEDEEEMKPLQ